jgi:hypothetical protein
MRTARSRTSDENRLEVIMAPPSQDVEPPANPERFSTSLASPQFTEIYLTFLDALRGAG